MSGETKKSCSVLSVKDVDGIEGVSMRINQMKEIKRSVDLINKAGEYDDIKKAADEIYEELNEGHAEIKQKKQIIEKLDQAVKNLEMQPKTNYKALTTLDTALIELEHEKTILRRHLSSLEKLNLYIDVLSYKIYEAEHDYESDMEELRKEKTQLLTNGNIEEEQLNAMLSEIDKKIQERQMMHVAAKTDLETRKIAVEHESRTKVHDLDTKIEQIRKKRSDALLDLEDQKLHATASELKVIEEQMEKLTIKYEEELMQLRKLQMAGWTDMGSEEKLVAVLEVKGLKATKSGGLLTRTGKRLSVEEADTMGLFDDLDVSWRKIKQGICNMQLKLEETEEGTEEVEVASETESMFSQMTSEDVNYLKDTLAKPLTLAMAEILVKQPRDPIHYLGHWLFKYRYNQEVDDAAKHDIAELTVERARVAKERWQAHVLQEAQRAVLTLLVRVEEEILRREIERAQRSQQDEYEEVTDNFGQMF